MDYLLHIIIMIGIYSIVCMAANLLTGLANYISLGFAAFYGIGAYITALCVLYFHLTIFPSLMLIITVNTIFALIIAIPSLRLKGDYFILATLGFQIIVYNILYNWTSVTKGPFGVAGISKPLIFGKLQLTGINGYLVLTLALAVFTGFVFYLLIRSPFGRILRGIRDDEVALLSLGRNVAYYKILAFVISAAFCGIGGYLYATYIGYIDPTSFSLDESIFILCALLIGGTGNLQGPVTGAVFIVLLPELLRFAGLHDNIAAPLRQILYGLALVLVMFYRKQGIAGESKFL